MIEFYDTIREIKNANKVQFHALFQSQIKCADWNLNAKYQFAYFVFLFLFFLFLFLFSLSKITCSAITVGILLK